MAKLTTVPFSGYYDYGHGFDANENREKYTLGLLLGQYFADVFVLHFVMMIAGGRKMYWLPFEPISDLVRRSKD